MLTWITNADSLEIRMSETDVSRRVVLRTMLLGTAGAALAACGGGQPPAAAPPAPEPMPPPAEPASAPEPAAAAPEPAPAPAAVGTLPALSPSDPTAVALGYTNDASTVDPKVATTYQPGQACANCVQYQGAAGNPQGPCAIFAGKSVAATGWCKVYAKKA